MKSSTIILTGNTANFITTLSPPIRLNHNNKYEAALQSISLYNAIPNIDETNNKFSYSSDGGNTWKLITIPMGSYQLETINSVIQYQMTVNNDFDDVNGEYYITISPNMSELKSLIEIKHELYQIDFTIENSIRSILGFTSKILTHNTHISDNLVDIMSVNSVLVNVDIISGCYVNGNQSPTIYSFSPHIVSPGYFINLTPTPLTYYPVNETNINSVTVFLTDQDGNRINVREQKVTVAISIREVINIKKEIKKAISELKKENIL